ncbi:PREDICTED: uncharacterized protein LOC109482319 [Branchiostoma belcheri]|uniref:Uncharacterized protein LOC109482319 n=1 Tax=Branchiostoma belcheri TaxID=7741 RepID=A0A6P4ZH96_BRABE|nr:PREDICTED: uncharacterized protein LOC109482319 [Branchiostoma belcheri]
MGRKLRHVLIFLLIILKEPSMPDSLDNCKFETLADYDCKPSSQHCRKGLTSIPQKLPTSISLLDLRLCLFVLIGAIILTVWYKIKSRRPSSGLNPNVVGGNTNTAVTVSVSNDDHEDTDKLGVQNGQGQANIQSQNVGNLSHNQVLAALKPNPMYAGTGNAAVSNL